MIISCVEDYREAARRRLPRFLFDYIDGGAGAEQTLAANIADLAQVRLKQRVLANVEDLSLETEWFGRRVGLPVVLAPVGMTGMFWRRGEAAVARAAAAAGAPYAPSTVSICAIEEIAEQSSAPLWFQLYVLKDRGFMRSVL
jgi:L-lactate dehydrogenase (cytochrome)